MDELLYSAVNAESTPQRVDMLVPGVVLIEARQASADVEIRSTQIDLTTGQSMGGGGGGTTKHSELTELEWSLAKHIIDQNIALGGYKFTGAGQATTNGEFLIYQQLIGLYLLLAGGTMAGDINMNNHALTNVPHGDDAGDPIVNGQETDNTTLGGNFPAVTFGNYAAGSGLMRTGGNQGLYVGAGAGIVVNLDDVAVDFPTAGSAGTTLKNQGTATQPARKDHVHWIEKVVVFPIKDPLSSTGGDTAHVVLNFPNGGEIIYDGCVGSVDVAPDSWDLEFKVQLCSWANYKTHAGESWSDILTGGHIESAEQHTDDSPPTRVSNYTFSAKDVMRVNITSSNTTARRLHVSMRIRVPSA